MLIEISVCTIRYRVWFGQKMRLSYRNFSQTTNFRISSNMFDCLRRFPNVSWRFIRRALRMYAIFENFRATPVAKSFVRLLGIANHRRGYLGWSLVTRDPRCHSNAVFRAPVYLLYAFVNSPVEIYLSQTRWRDYARLYYDLWSSRRNLRRFCRVSFVCIACVTGLSVC